MTNFTEGLDDSGTECCSEAAVGLEAAVDSIDVEVAALAKAGSVATADENIIPATNERFIFLFLS